MVLKLNYLYDRNTLIYIYTLRTKSIICNSSGTRFAICTSVILKLTDMKNQTITLDPEKVYNWNYNMSRHSSARSQQRGIGKDLLLLAMDYSEAIFKQGLIFFAVIERMLPENMDHHLREKLNNLVVVVSPESNEIVTCYRSVNGVHHIKRKSKRLN
jgi:hypothetical protein